MGKDWLVFPLYFYDQKKKKIKNTAQVSLSSVCVLGGRGGGGMGGCMCVREDRQTEREREREKGRGGQRGYKEPEAASL